MFRPMRRFRQLLPEEETIAILKSATSGVLALSGDDGYPYAVPMSYTYREGKLYFHGAMEGHKIDAVKRSEKASFCVISKDDIVPAEVTTYFRSVIAFGRIRLLEGEEKIAGLRLLIDKYTETPEHVAAGEKEIAEIGHRTVMMEFTIEHLTGKEARELMAERNT